MNCQYFIVLGERKSLLFVDMTSGRQIKLYCKSHSKNSMTLQNSTDGRKEKMKKNKKWREVEEENKKWRKLEEKS